jgi:hypothetical protein
MIRSRIYLIFALGLLFIGNSIAESKTYNLELLDMNPVDLCGKVFQKDVIIAPSLGTIVKSDSLVGFEIVIEYNPDVVQMNQQLYTNTMSQFFKFKNTTFDKERGEIIMEGFVSFDAFPNPVSGDFPLVAFGGTFIGECEQDADFKVKYFYPIDGFKGTVDTIKEISIKGVIADKPDRVLGFDIDDTERAIKSDSTIAIDVVVDLGIMESLDYWQTRVTIDTDSLCLSDVVGTESIIVEKVTKEEHNSYLIDLKVVDDQNMNLKLNIHSNKIDSALVNVKLETVESTECICATNFPESSFEISNLETKDTVIIASVNKIEDLVYSNGVIMSRNKILTIEVYNYAGMLIDSEVCDFNKVYDTKLLKQGIYFIKVTDGNNIEILKKTNN